MNQELAIVIPVHNRLRLTRQCLESLRGETCQEFSTIVVDDGSTDGTAAMIAREFPEVLLLHGDGNLWWTGATNLGVRRALEEGCRRIMTLNDDTIATPGFIGEMLGWSRKEPRALLGALGVDARTGEIVYGGERIDWLFCGSRNLLTGLPAERRVGLHKVTHFPGRGLLIPREVFQAIGFFDEEHFPHTAADYDFTHRAVRAGFRVFCNYDAKLGIFPEESGGVKLRQARSWRNYRSHLFSLKGGGNLRIFTHYALRNCPAPLLPGYLLQGYLRRLTGFWIHDRVL